MPFTGLLKGELWKDAAIQVFFSLGAAMGSLISLARYNKIKNNCHRQALIVCFANYLFSIISGMCVWNLTGITNEMAISRVYLVKYFKAQHTLA